MALRRDSKGRFLKRSRRKARTTKRAASPKRRKGGGLRSHKPGCKCVIHARAARRRTTAWRRTKRGLKRAKAQSRSKRRKAPVRTVKSRIRVAPKRRPGGQPKRSGSVTIQLNKSEAFSFIHNGPRIHAKVKQRAGSLLRTHTSVKVVGPTGSTLAHVHR